MEEEDILKKKEKAQKCKVIALNEMNMHPIITNTSNFTKKQKQTLLDKVSALFEKPEEEIQELFNDVCNEIVFVDGPKTDYTSYPVYAKS